MSPDPKKTAGPAVVQLARHLGLLEATMIGVGAMIGAGIFVLTGIAVGEAGPAAVLAFGLNGVVTLFTALSYAELASAIPEAGGGYSFVKKVLPNWMAFGSGWMLWFAYVVACSLYVKGFASYFLEFFARYFREISHFIESVLGFRIAESLLILLMGSFFIAINIIGTHASGKAENIITMAKIIILGVFIYFGIKTVLANPVQVRTNFTPLFPRGFSGVLAAMGLTFIAFEGYDLIATVSEEVKEPRKNIPRAIMLSLGITVVIYLLVVFVSLGAVPSAEGLPTWQLLGKYKETGIIRAAQDFMSRFGLILVLAGGLFATLSALNATVLASSRVAFAMGRDWMLPHNLSRIHSARKTPVLAIFTSGLLFLGVAVLVPIQTVGTASSLLFLLSFSMVNLALIVYRKRNRTQEAFFKVPLFPLTPVLGIISCLGLAAFQLFNEPLAWLLAVGWIVLGLGIYAFKFRSRVNVADVPKVIEVPELKELKKARHYKILIPLANPRRVRPLVEMAAKIARINQGELVGVNITVLPNVTAYTDAEPFLEEIKEVMYEAQKIALHNQVPFSSVIKISRSVGPQLLKIAREQKSNLILMGYLQEGEPLENSVINSLVQHQPCDVAILKTEHLECRPFRRVIMPVGGKIIHDRLKVRLLHSISKTDGCPVTFMISIAPGASRSRRRWAEESLERIARIYNLPDAELKVVEGENIADAIAALSRPDDLLLLGMKEQQWFKAFLFGSLSRQIASRVSCPLLLTRAIRPERKRLQQFIRRKRW